MADTLNPTGRFVFSAGAEQRLSRILRAKAGYSFGVIQNMTEDRGRSVYTIFDPVKQRANFTLIFKELTRNLDVSVTYEWSQRSAAWQVYQYGTYDGKVNQNYSFHSLTGGITWRF